MMAMSTSLYRTPVTLERIVMPRSFSSGLESMEPA